MLRETFNERYHYEVRGLDSTNLCGDCCHYGYEMPKDPEALKIPKYICREMERLGVDVNNAGRAAGCDLFDGKGSR